MINYSTCPVCDSKQLQEALSAKDYTVSAQQFTIEKCINCSLLFTQNVPTQAQIGEYYNSENYISHSNTQQGIVNNLYHQVRKFTLASKLTLITKNTSSKMLSLLDIGCGTGAFLNAAKQAGWQVTGLEPDENTRAKAKVLYNLEVLPAHHLFELAPNKYDVITMWHVLEHVHALQDYIIEIKKLLTQNGTLLIAVPNYTSLDAQHYHKYWAAYDVPRHLYHFSPKSMQILMERHGFFIKKIKPMWFDAFYVSMMSEQYKKNKLYFIKALFIGLLSNAKAMFNYAKCSSIIYVIKNKNM